MKVFLDDSRATPKGWIRTYTVAETITMLQTGSVTEISLDHHLGADAMDDGEEVLQWLESQVRTAGFRPPDAILVHTGDAEARARMEAAAERIQGLGRGRIASDGRQT